MDDFARDLLAVFAAHTSQTFAWCVLPNHYHALVEAPDVRESGGGHPVPRQHGLRGIALYHLDLLIGAFCLA